VALELGIACDGWCPRGRRAEDGRIPERYPLREAASTAYAPRTRLNVAAADATLILTAGPLGRGTRLTLNTARELGKPVLVLDLRESPSTAAVADWLRRENVRVLNVAGPRASQSPTIAADAAAFLRRLLSTRRRAEPRRRASRSRR
jgi:hypothetical protein